MAIEGRTLAAALAFKAAPWLLVGGLAAGGLSLDRLTGSYVELGYIGELRFILVVGAALLAIVQYLPRGGAEHRLGSSGLWAAGVCGFHVLLIVTWFWSTGSDFASSQVFETVLLILAVSAAYRLFAPQPKRYLIALQRLSIAVAMLITIVGMALFGMVRGDLSSVGAGGIGTARVLAVGILYLTYLYFSEARVIYLLPVPIMILEMASSGSRAAFLALLVGLAILWLLRRRLASGVPVGIGSLFLVAAVAIGVLLLGWWWAPSREVLVSFVASNFVINPMTSQTAGLYLADRDIIFASAWRFFLDNFYAGGGLGSYRGPFGELYPHNLFLNMADDAGAGAVACCLLLLAWPVFRLLRSKDGLSVLALANAAFFLVASMFAGTYYDARFVWVFLLLGLLNTERNVTCQRQG